MRHRNALVSIATLGMSDDFLNSGDHVSGNDQADGGQNTDTCRVDAGGPTLECELQRLA